MLQLCYNDVAALFIILQSITVKELITLALDNYLQQDNINSKDKASICYNTIKTFYN